MLDYAPFLIVSTVGNEVLVQCLDASPWKSNIEVADAFLKAYRNEKQYEGKSLKLYVLNNAGKWWLLFNLLHPGDRRLQDRLSRTQQMEGGK
jgi:hypothetical protein